MIAIIQTATNAAGTTNETQGTEQETQETYGGLTDLVAKLDNARPVQREREKGLNKGIPKLESAIHESTAMRMGTTGREGHRDT
jgi:hypothetical protein